MGLKSYLHKRSKRKATKAKLAQAFQGNAIGKRQMIAMAQAEGILPYPDRTPHMGDDKSLVANVTRYTKHGDGSVTRQERSSRLLMKIRRMDRVQVRKYLQAIS